MAFAVCYVPNVCIGIWILFNSEKFVMYVSWPGQVFHLCLFLSSAINPFIYCLRLRRFRCALKQLLRNPCGRTPFQETNNKRQVRQRIPHQVPRGEKNMDESNQAILMLFNNSNLRTRRMAFTPRVSETRERSEKKEKECLPGVGNQVMTLSIKDLQPPNIPRLAWVKKHSTDSAGTSFREESSTLKADNTRHVVIVEVHPVPKDKPMKQKEAQLPTLTDEYVQEERKRWKSSFRENGLRAVKPEFFSQRVGGTLQITQHKKILKRWV